MKQQTSTYRIEFDPAWPVPPITVDFADRTAAARRVAEHAIPHLRPVLVEKGHPEYTDCIFHADRDLTVGQFMWIDFQTGGGARFCPARLKPTDLDPDICGDDNDDEVCDLEPGHDGDHCANAAVGWPNTFAAPAAAVSAGGEHKHDPAAWRRPSA